MKDLDLHFLWRQRMLDRMKLPGARSEDPPAHGGLTEAAASLHNVVSRLPSSYSLLPIPHSLPMVEKPGDWPWSSWRLYFIVEAPFRAAHFVKLNFANP
jgi:hypothetical protein